MDPFNQIVNLLAQLVPDKKRIRKIAKSLGLSELLDTTGNARDVWRRLLSAIVGEQAGARLLRSLRELNINFGDEIAELIARIAEPRASAKPPPREDDALAEEVATLPAANGGHAEANGGSGPPASDTVREKPSGLGASEPSLPAAIAELRLDVAAPPQVEFNRSFNIAVAVKQMASPVLREDDLTLVKSDETEVEFAEGAAYVKLLVEVSAPDCEIDRPRQSFRLRRGEDSPPLNFSLKPKITGDIGIVVRLFQEDEVLGSTRISTVVGRKPTGEVMLVVSSTSLDKQPGEVPPRDAIRQALVEKFSVAELKALCFAMTSLLEKQGIAETIDLDLIGGDGKDERVVNLIEYVARRDWEDVLVKAMRAEREGVI